MIHKTDTCFATVVGYLKLNVCFIFTPAVSYHDGGPGCHLMFLICANFAEIMCAFQTVLFGVIMASRPITPNLKVSMLRFYTAVCIMSHSAVGFIWVVSIEAVELSILFQIAHKRPNH